MKIMHIQPPLFQIIKLELKIVFSSATMSTANYLPSLIAGLYFPPLLITMKSLLAIRCHLEIPNVTTTTYDKGAFISMATKNME